MVDGLPDDAVAMISRVEPIPCEACNRRVAPRADGTCPACRSPMAVPAVEPVAEEAPIAVVPAEVEEDDGFEVVYDVEREVIALGLDARTVKRLKRMTVIIKAANLVSLAFLIMLPLSILMIAGNIVILVWQRGLERTGVARGVELVGTYDIQAICSKHPTVNLLACYRARRRIPLFWLVVLAVLFVAFVGVVIAVV